MRAASEPVEVSCSVAVREEDVIDARGMRGRSWCGRRSRQMDVARLSTTPFAARARESPGPGRRAPASEPPPDLPAPPVIPSMYVPMYVCYCGCVSDSAKLHSRINEPRGIRYNDARYSPLLRCRGNVRERPSLPGSSDSPRKR